MPDLLPHPARSMARANDLTIYEREAAAWWDPRSRAFRSLHAVNRLRVELVLEWLGPRLRGARVVDLGCGGGLLAAPLARAGARVVGVDLSPASLAQARDHVAGAFVRGDLLRAPVADGQADLVLLADVVEHVSEPGAALSEAARLLRPGGACFVNTINRTARARWLAVHVAEGLGLVPRGTHDARLFVRPEELEAHGARHGLALERLQGEGVDLLRTLGRWAITPRRSEDLSVAYSALLRKAGAP